MTDTLPLDPAAYPQLARVLDAALAQWPDHASYMRINLGERDPALLAFSERLAGIVCRIAEAGAADLTTLADDYRYMCQKIILPEEMHFRRHGTYRLTRFDEALSDVYQNAPVMARYMNGLLLSHVMWIKHSKSMQHYQERFLAGLGAGADLLEIGPGHGLLLHLAAEQDHIGSLTAWDISDTSLDLAARNLGILGAAKPATFEKRDIFALDVMAEENAGRFDGIVLSEVLEHLETPGKAIETLYHLCKPGGEVWINVPANSPAPDHLYLLRSLAEAEELVRSNGFSIAQSAAFPPSGATLEQAAQRELAVSCIIVGRKGG